MWKGQNHFILSAWKKRLPHSSLALCEAHSHYSRKDNWTKFQASFWAEGNIPDMGIDPGYEGRAPFFQWIGLLRKPN